MTVPFTFTRSDKGSVLTMIIDGNSVAVRDDHPGFTSIFEALKDIETTDEALLALVRHNGFLPEDIKEFVESAGSDKASVDSEGRVFYQGEEVHSTIAERIRQFMQAGLPFDHLLRFLERVDKNPSYASRKELFDFLEHEGLPITEDGHFLAYKAVRNDYMDIYSGSISNKIGNTVSMSRSKVDDDRGHGCSSGLHIGALNYVYSYGSDNGRIVQVKVDPTDVVSVPTCSAYQKCRTCAYEVVADFKGELLDPLYDAKGEGSLTDVEKKLGYSVEMWNFADDDPKALLDEYYNPEDIDVIEAGEDFDTEDDDDLNEDDGFFKGGGFFGWN